MRTLLDFLIGLVLFFLQLTFLHSFSVGGIIPELMLIYIIALGLLCGSRRGGFAGFLLGLVQDLYFGPLLGYTALLYMLMGACAGIFHQNFDRSRLMLPLGLTAFFSLIYGLLSSVFFLVIPKILPFSLCFIQRVIPSVIYTCLVQVPVYVVMFLLFPLIKKAFSGLHGRFFAAQER